mmetsp:Transcript_6399/g.9372  ORF Transcript_6399/g.9372 Transcript_6399/m.9372 type:complete len:81 (+) Transcript_6399:161-403(+)
MQESAGGRRPADRPVTVMYFFSAIVTFSRNTAQGLSANIIKRKNLNKINFTKDPYVLFTLSDRVADFLSKLPQVLRHHEN